MTEDQIRQILDSQMERLEQCFRGGLADYLKHYNGLGHIHSKITQANLLRDHIVDHAKNIFSGKTDEGIYLREMSNGLFCVEMSGKPFGIDDAIWIRFKKLSKKLLTANIPTGQALNFNAQRPVAIKAGQLQLPGVDWGLKPSIEPDHLNAGYVLNDLRTGFDGLFITFPTGKSSMAWYANIGKRGSQRQATVVPIPVGTTIQQKPTVRVRAKEHAKKQRIKINESIS